MKRPILIVFLLIMVFALWCDIPAEEFDQSDELITSEEVLDDDLPAEVSIFVKFLVAMAISVMVEFIVIAALFKPIQGIPIAGFGGWARLFGIVAGATMVTISILWWPLRSLLTNYLIYLVVGEMAVLGMEAVAYKYLLPCKWNSALVFSTVANLGSFLVGIFLMDLIF